MCLVTWTALAAFPVVIWVRTDCLSVGESLEGQPQEGTCWPGWRSWRTLEIVDLLTPSLEAIWQVNIPLEARERMFSFWAEEVACLLDWGTLWMLALVKYIEVRNHLRYNHPDNYLWNFSSHRNQPPSDSDISDTHSNNCLNESSNWIGYISMDTASNYIISNLACSHYVMLSLIY